tara:strand:- start:385 stop:714 length:330 start_codon:yes stop_codon:yes gene_type:complete
MAKFKNPTQATWERVAKVSDGGGGNTLTWNSQASINIIIIPKSGSETFKSERLQTQVTHVIYMLYDDASTITTKDRIVFESRYFNILEDIDIVEGQMWIKAMCKEGVAS